MPGGVASFHSQGSRAHLEPDPGVKSEEGGSVVGVNGGGGVTAMSTLWNPGDRGGPNGAGSATEASARITSSSVRLGEVCIGDTSGELTPLSMAGGGVGSFLGSCCFPLAFFFCRRSRGGVSSAIKECSGVSAIGRVPTGRFRDDVLPLCSSKGVGMSIGERGGGRGREGSVGDRGGGVGPGWEEGVFLDRCFLFTSLSHVVTQCPAPLQ